MGCTQSSTAATVTEPVDVATVDHVTVAAPTDVAAAVEAAEEAAAAVDVVVDDQVTTQVTTNDFTIATTSIENGVVLYHVQIQDRVVAKKRFNEFKLFHQRVASVEAVPALPEAGLFTAFKRRNEDLIKERAERLQAILNAAPRDEVDRFIVVVQEAVVEEQVVAEVVEEVAEQVVDVPAAVAEEVVEAPVEAAVEAVAEVPAVVVEAVVETPAVVEEVAVEAAAAPEVVAEVAEPAAATVVEADVETPAAVEEVEAPKAEVVEVAAEPAVEATPAAKAEHATTEVAKDGAVHAADKEAAAVVA
ncbi:Aste57867_1103 [Aphanomyces stellatus]|uniref:Aste57867_1103 protein n=1 Tax=Aphanomyces stellatus TaxID=120398 RepID=A0A485K5F1_9STRA|nr:hypothetical protein As57867_001102 [Aphanomyces stellatus]VFT78324.1 Aste57867_1103 [Aphanomyces stellatus]